MLIKLKLKVEKVELLVSAIVDLDRPNRIIWDMSEVESPTGVMGYADDLAEPYRTQLEDELMEVY